METQNNIIIENTTQVKRGRGRPRKENINPKEYYQTFKKKFPEIITKKYECEVCGGSYTYFTKSSHLKTKKHLNVLKLYTLKPQPTIPPNETEIVELSLSQHH
jgi:transposase-like protein